MYIERHLQQALAKAEKQFGAVLVTGSRQVGKTTLLRKTKAGLPYLTLDDPLVMTAAVDAPATFFKINPPPLVLDEVQYAPSLFPGIKLNLDSSGKKGQFFLSGSQQFHLMKHVGESLAGRIGILNLLGLSLREIFGQPFYRPFIPSGKYLRDRQGSAKAMDIRSVWEIIHRGSMPEMTTDKEMDWQMYHAAYTRTYIERDVRDFAQVGDEVKFIKFITAAAAMTGQLLNLGSLARDVGVSPPTAERWLSILQAANLVYLLQPYHNNIVKRTIKTPKLYFLDTGLAAYLTRWNTPETMESGAMAGAFFETFVVAEVLKSHANAGILEPPLFFYRDKDKREIDLVIQDGRILHPLEIKKHADPSKKDLKSFAALENIPAVARGDGGVICLYDKVTPLTENDMVIPLSFI